MPSKTQIRKASEERKFFPLTDSINTEEWKCAVALLAEASPSDACLTRFFSEEAAKEARKEVKSIDFERDLMKILKEFISGEISYGYAFLLNFSEVFQEACLYLKNSEKIPAPLTARLIKAVLFKLRKDDTDRAKAGECGRDEIEVMASKPLAPPGPDVLEKIEVGNYNDKKKPTKNTTDLISDKALVKVRPPSNAKEDTKLLRRGKQVKALDFIDDAPEDTFFNMYVALTGFRDPELALEMIKIHIPLHGVFCLSSPVPKIPDTPQPKTDQEKYWSRFLEILWNTKHANHFSDVVFHLYAPAELPQREKELRSFIYREISFLMYDLSDLKYQLTTYLRSMRLLNVDEGPEKFEPSESFKNELAKMPYECVSVPVFTRHVLDLVCGEDGQVEEEEEEEEKEQVLCDSRTSSSFASRRMAEDESKASFTSIIPFNSTVRLPSPRWSSLIESFEKQAFYKKIKALETVYDMEEYSDASVCDSSGKNYCGARRTNRLSSPYLDAEIQNYSYGILKKFWRNYPRPEADASSNEFIPGINFPDFLINYVLYVLWINRMERVPAGNETISITNTEVSHTKFTVTDCSRIALHKAFRAKYFFSPSQLKIVPSDMLASVSAPELTSRSPFSWTDKSFVSDFHLPVKYLLGTPMTVFDKLSNYLGEEAFSNMKDYNFVEELSKDDMIRRVEDAVAYYDNVKQAYSPLTDSVYVIMWNNTSDIKREVYNVMLTTPVGLRDFHDYILDDEKDWLNRLKSEAKGSKRKERCPNKLYNPTPDFRSFTDYDFWHENSIKYKNHAEEVLESVIQNVENGRTEKGEKETAEGCGGVDNPSPVYAKPGESYCFIGYDFEPGAVQYSGMETTFKSPDNCSVRVCLRERLYGAQQLGIHIQQGGHNLHLYSYVCPQPHLQQPNTFHIEYKNGIIAAFSRRIKKIFTEASTDGDSETHLSVEDDNFCYDMMVSFPHGLVLETIKNHVEPCYIKQSYKYATDGDALTNEKKRLFLPNGNVVKIMKDDTVEVLKPDTSIVRASLTDLEERFLEDDTNWCFKSYTETMSNGCHYTVVNGEITETKRFQIIKNSVMETQEKYLRRMDSTNYVILEDGTFCVEYHDGTKISTSIREEIFFDWDFYYGEDGIDEPYTAVNIKTVMEHPKYATVIYESSVSWWKILLPNKSDIEIDLTGCHRAHIDGQTEFDISAKQIRIWRCNERDEFVTCTIADLTVFENRNSSIYTTTIDSLGKKFVVEADGSCYVTENDSSTTIGKSEREEAQEPKKYFVVRRDLSGFEIIDTETVRRELENVKPETITFCQEMKTLPVTRYFALFENPPEKPENKWKVESITPNTRFAMKKTENRSTYGRPPSWMHPFPIKKPELQIPEIFKARIFQEIKPTDCPAPVFSSNYYAFVDLSRLPEPSISLSENIPKLVQNVIHQDQETLKEIYLTAVKQRAASNKLNRPIGGPHLEKYLSMSKYHVERREFYKRAIRHNSITGYFDHPTGAVWRILQTLIEIAVRDGDKRDTEIPQTLSTIKSSQKSSEIEYNLSFSSEPSYSELSCMSNLTSKTAPPAIQNIPASPLHINTPRDTKSEPAYKLEEIINPDDDLSYVYGYSFTPPSSEICVFRKEDLLTLERMSSPKENESSPPTYEMEDLMTLGLI